MENIQLIRDIGLPAAGLIACFFYLIIPLKDRHLKFLDKLEETIDKITETQSKIVESQSLISREVERLSRIFSKPEHQEK